MAFYYLHEKFHGSKSECMVSRLARPARRASGREESEDEDNDKADDENLQSDEEDGAAAITAALAAARPASTGDNVRMYCTICTMP